MTIIVYDPAADSIYIDSKYSWSNGRAPFTATKVHNVGGYLIAATGSVKDQAWYEQIVSAIKSGERIIQGVPSDLCLDVVVRAPRNGADLGLAFVATSDDGQPCITINVMTGAPHDFVFGSGGGFYTAYLSAGQSIEDAVTNAARFHNECGLPIDKF